MVIKYKNTVLFLAFLPTSCELLLKSLSFSETLSSGIKTFVCSVCLSCGENKQFYSKKDNSRSLGIIYVIHLKMCIICEHISLKLEIGLGMC